MKKQLIKICALGATLLVLATSCKKGDTGPAGATGATGPALSGNLQGVVTLYDVSGAKILTAATLAGDSITLTNNSTGAVLKTTTSSTGSYTFANISTGTYGMATTKTGYGMVLTQGIQFAGGGNADRNIALSVIPTTSVTSALAVDTGIAGAGVGNTAENYIKVRGYVPTSTGETTVMVFIGLPNVSSASSTPGNYSATYTATVAPGATKFTINIPTANLYDYGYVSNSAAYFAAYIVGGTTSASSYADWATGQTVYTALSSQPVVVSVAHIQ